MTPEGCQPHSLVAHLLPNGHVAIAGGDPDPDATWQVLGCTPYEGCFVRAELAGASWVTHIQPTSLEHLNRDLLVTLARQSEPPREPLRGWILFC